MVADYINVIMDDPAYANSHPTVLVSEALTRISQDGRQFWGSFAGALFTRRRTVLDSVLQSWDAVS